MPPYITPFCTRPRAEVPYLLLSPPHKPGEEGQSHRLKTNTEVGFGPEAQGFMPDIPRPLIDGPFERYSHNVNEACIGHHFRCPATRVEEETRSSTSLHHEIIPSPQIAFGWNRPVIASHGKVDILDLEPPPRVEVPARQC